MNSAAFSTLDLDDLGRVQGGQSSTSFEGQVKTPTVEAAIKAASSKTNVAACFNETRAACNTLNPGTTFTKNPAAGKCMLDNMYKCEAFK